MQITIAYDSVWRNSFLDGSNNEPLPKQGKKAVGRKYKAASSNLKKEEDCIKKIITTDTVMGVLNRLIGDQRKLYQIINSDNNFFADIRNNISFDDLKENLIETQEMVYLRNISGSNDPKSFIGSVKTNHPLFNSDYSSQLWGILTLSLDEIVDFILGNEASRSHENNTDPFYISEKVDSLKPIKTNKVNNIHELQEACNYLQRNQFLNNELKRLFPKMRKLFSDGIYLKNDSVQSKAIYCSSLYIQFIRLSKEYDLSDVHLKGVSVNNFTVKNFKELFTGGMKKVYGNPYGIKEFKALKPMLTKASGKLEITIDVNKDKAKEIRTMIRDAGVSSFYLGKKGLAYVEDIKVAEVRR